MKRFIQVLVFSVSSGALFAQVDTPAVDIDTISDKTNIIPVFVTDADALESEAQSQDVSGLLQASRDVYVGIAGFNFSAARYRLRGYSSEHFSVMMNGIPMNDPESGWAIWAYWGGLNDITRYPETKNGISSSQIDFGGIGGYSNINLRAAKIRKGSRVSYAMTNRSYRHRAIFTHSTGLNKKGWAFAFSGAYRHSQEGYVEGSYFSGGSYFGSVSKQLDKRHMLSLSAFGSPTVQGRQGIAVQETYDLTGNNFYNPYWGYQNGEKRNARVRNNHKPYVFLTHDFTIDSTSRLETTAYGIFGRTSNSNLNWYQAPDPRPDYYRYLPSYNTSENPSIAAQQTAAWTSNDATVTQINWDQLYFANSKNLYTLENADGIQGNSVTGNRSKYIVEEYRQDPRQFGLKTVYNKTLGDQMNFTVGAQYESYKSKNFRLMNDLLGGDFWVDVDQFAERDFADPNSAQNDVDNPNKLIREGDVFGYNYDINQSKINAFGNLDFKLKKLDGYVGLALSSTTFWRTGQFKNGRFPNNSFGDSEKQSFVNYGLKAGLVYKLTGRHLFTINGTYRTMAPFARNAYISPRTRDQLVDGLESSVILSGDVNYLARFHNFKARVTGFYTQVNNQTWARSFYHDEYRTFVNYVMTGVDQLMMGIEVGAEYTLAQSHVLSLAFTTGDYIYNSRPTATISQDNSQELLAENRTVYLQNYEMGGPQTLLSAGYKYNSPKYWFAGVNFNYFADIYLSPNPDRRTAEAVDAFVVEDPQWDETLRPTELDNGYTLNAFIGKSWRIKSGQYLRANLNVSNILNNTTFRTGGYEQLRYNPGEISKFPPKFGYMYGLTYFAMVTYQF